MRIRILQGIAGARQAQGIAVVIDAFRAFSLECYLFEAGAARVLPVGAVETAYGLKEKDPAYVLAGERKGRILPGFDLGNSPAQIQADAVRGKTVAHTTSSGTQGIVAAFAGADEVLTGSLVNAAAIAKYIAEKNPAEVSLICMGAACVRETPEDTLCGRYIKSLLTGEAIDMAEELCALRLSPEGSKFFNPDTQDVFPQGDYALCTDVDRFGFVLRVARLGEDVFESVPHRVMPDRG